MRLVDEFLAKSGVANCPNFKETAEVVAKVAFKMFLGVNVDVSQWNAEGDACSLVLYENPLTGTEGYVMVTRLFWVASFDYFWIVIAEFVELPPSAYGVLWYSNVLCGVLRGALEMVQMRVEAHFVKDVLQGDDVSEIRWGVWLRAVVAVDFVDTNSVVALVVMVCMYLSVCRLELKGMIEEAMGDEYNED